MIKYIDLFAGIGGFHQALNNIGGFKCVFASEIDKDASDIYKLNFGIDPSSDITAIHEKTIPSHDLLCAGFPCQPFSKSGPQRGFNDIRGTLFYDIIRIAKEHKPKIILLENVANISSHDNGNTIRVIHDKLKEIGYLTSPKDITLSPNEFGIPVNRPRTYIIAIESDCKFNFHKFSQDISTLKVSKDDNNIYEYFQFEPSHDPSLTFTEYQVKVLEMLDEFYKNIDADGLGFPIWYDFFKKKPFLQYPKWKTQIISKNNILYSNNKEFIDNWELKHEKLNWVMPTHRKFEWHCGNSITSVFNGLIQFRPSGVRVKKPNYFSTLVAINQPQYIGKYKRRLSPNECKYLQSFPSNFIVHPNDKLALKQLGNSVNVKLIELIVKSILLRLNSQEL